MPILYILNKWNYITCDLLWLVSFTWPNVSLNYPCYTMCQYSIPFYCQIILHCTGYHILFTYSLFNEHFGCSHFLIIKNVAMSVCAQVLLGHLFSFLLGIYLGVQFLGCMVILCLIFWGDTILFSKVAEPFCIPISNVLGFRFLHVLLSVFLIINILVDTWYLIVV